jgi:hypothetical protein
MDNLMGLLEGMTCLIYCQEILHAKYIFELHAA